MQGIFDYVSAGNLWAIAIIAAVSAILAANSNYQKRGALALHRVAPRPAKATRASDEAVTHAKAA